VIYSLNVLRYILTRLKRGSVLSIIRLIHLILVVVPFAFIGSLSDKQDRVREFVVVFSLIRISDLMPIQELYMYITKKYTNKVNVIRILHVLNIYLVLAHFIACMWIEVAKIEDDDERSWIRRAPVPRPSGTREDSAMEISKQSLYIHAIYWSIVTFSHIGVGDITAITVPERAFNCAAILIYTFAYAILFGNMASLVSGLANNDKSKMYKQYQFVMNIITKKRLTTFKTSIEEFFNYIWSVDMGLSQDELLSTLPSTLITEIRMTRYNSILQKTELFQDHN
jgi:hypothetical protein